MNNLLVTGASGLIGPQVADALSRDRDTDVYAVDNYVRGENDAANRALRANPLACHN